MTAVIRLRRVPDALYRRLEQRASSAGLSLSDYLLNEIRKVAEQPTLEEMRARLQSLPAAPFSLMPADAVRAERDSR